MEDSIRLMVDLHEGGERQGPGGPKEVRKAIELAGLGAAGPLRIADIGCGTGASTRLLAQELNARIAAVDLFPEFLRALQRRARAECITGSIAPLAASMEALPFQEEVFDVVWSEGAVYLMGFEAGITAWRRYLKPGGLLVVSEITWLTAERPQEVQRFWQEAYPEIAPASVKMGQLERQGYSPLGYFPLPEDCWMANFYLPLRARRPSFLERHGHSEAAQALVEADEQENALYERYCKYYSYGMYTAKKL